MIDYFLVRLPLRGMCYFGECCGCSAPVLDETAGGAFVCRACAQSRCQWCGYRKDHHTGMFDVRRIIGNPTEFDMPPGECPDYRRAVCIDCLRQIGNSAVLITASGVMHKHDCVGDKSITELEAPYLRDDSELMPKLVEHEEDHREMLAAVRALPKPWRADTTWRKP